MKALLVTLPPGPKHVIETNVSLSTKMSLTPEVGKLPSKLLKQPVVLPELQAISASPGPKMTGGTDILICGGGGTTDNIAVLVILAPLASVHLTVTDISLTVWELSTLVPEVPLIERGPAMSVQLEKPLELHLKVDGWLVCTVDGENETLSVGLLTIRVASTILLMLKPQISVAVMLLVGVRVIVPLVPKV
jgi:hypothetical protein